MRSVSRLLIAASLTFALAAGASPAAHASGPTTVRTTSKAAPNAVLSGKVMGPSGALAGAVVEVAGTKMITATNSEGVFLLSLPASRGALQLTTSYGGFADEIIALDPTTTEVTVQMAHGKTIQVARKQRLKAYLRTSRRQMRRQLRRLHRRA